jgi:antagonist of KipI
MSLTISKAGLHDTVQDMGRYGFQHQGINPGGTMDRFSASLANALVGNELAAPVIEMHFPAPQMLFQQPTIICLAGADFNPIINGKEVALHQPIAVGAGSLLSFAKKRMGARCYLALSSSLQIKPWLNSYSTNLKAIAGGHNGRRLEKGVMIVYNAMPFSLDETVLPLPWQYREADDYSSATEVVFGPEWNWLTEDSRTRFLNTDFLITPSSDRMGYRLQGKALEQAHKESLISSAVCFGTVQLLPNGQLILLMADHQTTGGYPRIAIVVRNSLPTVAQMGPGETLRFRATTVAAAEENWIAQQKLLQHLKNTCKLKLQNWLHAHRH